MADEVRQLAEMTSNKVVEIGAIIAAIESSMDTFSTVITEQKEMAVRGSGNAEAVMQLLTEVFGNIRQMVEGVNGIASAVGEQRAASQSIASNLEGVALMTEETSRAVQESSEQARHLQELSDRLVGMVDRFKI